MTDPRPPRRAFLEQFEPLLQFPGIQPPVAPTQTDTPILQDNCAVLVPEGYHPVVSAPGYTTYYLNVLAGSAQSLARSQ